MPRIRPLSTDDPTVQRLLSAAEHISRGPENVYRVLATHPALLDVFTRFGTYLFTEGQTAARQRKLVVLRTGWRSRSEYEFGQHTVIGRRAGLTDDEIARLARASDDDWSADDGALVRMDDELCADDLVSDGTWRALAECWSEQQLLELLMLVGYYRLVSGVLNSAGVPLEPSTPGWPDEAEPGSVRSAQRDGEP